MAVTKFRYTIFIKSGSRRAAVAIFWLSMAFALASSPLKAAQRALSRTPPPPVRMAQPVVDTVTPSITATEAKILATGTGPEITKQLTAVVQRLNARPQVGAKPESLSLGAAHALVAAMIAKKTPRHQWSTVFDQLLKQYLRLGKQLDTAQYPGEELRILVSRADVARQLGQLDIADRLLEIAIDMARPATRSAISPNNPLRPMASLMAARASLAFARLENSWGATLLESAFDAMKNNPAIETVGWLFEAGDTWLTEDQSDAALRAFKSAQNAALAMAVREPANMQWQRELSVSHDKMGDVLTARGDPAAALKSYQAGLAIAQRLAAQDPRNLSLVHDLAISHGSIGDALAALGDYSAALGSYLFALSLQQKVTAGDSRNASFLRELAGLHVNAGDTHAALGDATEALKSYQAALSIRDRLATLETNDTDTQRELASTHNKVGDALAAQAAPGNMSAALNSYRAALSIRSRLAVADPLDTELQRELVMPYVKVGDTQTALGERVAALASYQAGLAIQEKLAANDPRNTELLRDLSVSHNRLGDVQAARGDNSSAYKHYHASRAIREKLLAGDPNNTQLQRDLAVSYRNLARVGAAGSSIDERRALMQKGLDILTRQRDKGQMPPSHASWIPLFQDGLQALK